MLGLRVLSAQSTVVHGAVGNKSATFPLQLLGFDVDTLNTVALSNHTAYASTAGERLVSAQVEALLGGLRANGLLPLYTHVLTGYVPSAAVLRCLAGAVRELRAARPGVVFVCDPVLGDNGRLVSGRRGGRVRCVCRCVSVSG